MNKIKNNKKLKIFLYAVVSIILLSGIFFALIFSNSSYSIPETKVSSNLIDKIRLSQKQGSVLELNKDELNQIVSMYFKKGKSSTGIDIKGVQGDILDNNLKFYIPVSYKGFNLLITSEGGLAYKNDKIEYSPLYFKAGKITLPKTFILDKLQSHFKGTISSENGVIVANKNIIPIQVKSIEVKNNKVLIGMVKVSSTLEEKLKSIESEIGKKVSDNPILKESSGKDSSAKNSTDTTKEEGNTGTNLDSASNSSGNSQNTSEIDPALDRISGSLSAAMGSVSKGSQKAVISEMISAVNSMKGNPSANPYSSAGSVKAAYKALSPQEKAELKSAVFSNVNGSDINIVSKMLEK
jgi:hypothetical protein